MKGFYSLIPFLALAALLAGCVGGGQNTEVRPNIDGPESAIQKTIYVGPLLLDCVGVAPQKCMQIKEDPAENYRLYYDQIEGFDFEEGYEYKLIVKEEQIENPPADGPSTRWVLVTQESKTPAASTLEDVLWGVIALLNAEGQQVNVLEGSQLTAEFKDGNVSGTGGCNNYSGAALVKGDNLAIGPLASTMMFCMQPEGVMDQESNFLANMQNAATYKVAGGKLEIFDAEGTLLLAFQELQPTALVDTPWSLVMYNNGREAIVSTIADTNITANFAPDGQLSGTAGCNNYSAGYTLDGDKMTIGPVATTRKMCAEPEGVMEQEAAYTAALGMVRSYKVEMNTLTLFGDTGNIVAQYTVAR